MKCPICNNECTQSTWTLIHATYHIIKCPNCYFSLKADTKEGVTQTYNSLKKTKYLADQLLYLAEYLPTAGKLRLLADWFDFYDSRKENTDNEVQCDLRTWADTVEEIKKIID